MLENINLSMEGMSSLIYLQEVIANNLANVNTVGFKRERFFPEVLSDASIQAETNCEEITIFDQGPLRETKNSLDMAIEGEGFFTIQTPEGIRYTRNGSFKLNFMGQLGMDENALVMGESGPIEVTGEITVNGRGEIYQKGEMIDRLRIVTFERPYPIKKAGYNLFVPEEDQVDEIEVEDARIMQGFVEESNVEPIKEMVNMLSLFRFFEAGQKTLTTYDEMLDKSANVIGRV